VLPRLQNDLFRAELLEKVLTWTRKQRNILLKLLTVSDVNRRRRLIEADPGSEASEHCDPVVFPVLQAVPIRRHFLLHRDRYEHVRVASKLLTAETFLRHAHDRHGVPVDDYCLVEHGGIRSETRGPVPVCEHDNRMTAWYPIVVFIENAAQNRVHAENLEVISRYQICSSRKSGVLVGQAGGSASRTCQAGEWRLLRLHLAEHWITERRSSGLVGRHAALRRSRVVQEDQLLRIPDRKRTQQHTIEHRKDCGVRPDAQRKR
jgi:hypothetical protein